MRVALYFVAFGFLFAFVIPMLIGVSIQNDDQSAWRIPKNELPAAAVEKSGMEKNVNNCDTEGYRYLITSDGFPYLQEKNTPYIAVLIENRVAPFRIDQNINRAIPEVEKNWRPEEMNRLSSILSTCIESNREPGVTTILLQKENKSSHQ